VEQFEQSSPGYDQHPMKHANWRSSWPVQAVQQSI